MSVRYLYACGGCDASAESSDFLHREFVSLSGRGYGFGSWKTVGTAQELAPSGWIAFDPYTQCCYCPQCWSEIEAKTSQAEADAERSDDACSERGSGG